LQGVVSTREKLSMVLRDRSVSIGIRKQDQFEAHLRSFNEEKSTREVKKRKHLQNLRNLLSMVRVQISSS